jgi:hypothetical protein
MGDKKMDAMANLLARKENESKYIISSVTFKESTIKKLDKLQTAGKKKVPRSTVIEILVDEFCKKNGIEV